MVGAVGVRWLGAESWLPEQLAGSCLEDQGCLGLVRHA